MAQNAAEEPSAQLDEIAINRRILNRRPNFFGEFWGKHLIGIQQKNPIVSDGKRVHGPLPLLWPSTLIMKLHDLGAVGSSDLDGIVRALRVDYVNFANSFQCLQTSRQVFPFVARCNDHANRERAGGNGTGE